MVKLKYLRPVGIKQLANSKGKRCGMDFLQELDQHVHNLVTRCCQEHDGGKKTLDRIILIEKLIAKKIL